MLDIKDVSRYYKLKDKKFKFKLCKRKFKDRIKHNFGNKFEYVIIDEIKNWEE